MTRDSDLIIGELAHSLGVSWQSLPVLVVVDHLDLDGRPLVCFSTGADRIVEQLQALEEVASAWGDEHVTDRDHGLDASSSVHHVWADPQRLSALLTTVELGRWASSLDSARRALGRGEGKLHGAKVHAERVSCREAYVEHLSEQLVEARRSLSRARAGDVGGYEASLRAWAERLAPLALVGERLFDLPGVQLPRGLESTTRRLLETALRVGALLEAAARRDPALHLDLGLSASCAWLALERELNTSWFRVLPGGWCPLDSILERASGIHGTSLVSALDECGVAAPRREDFDALERIISVRERYLDHAELEVKDLRRFFADLIDGGLLASLRMMRETLVRSATRAASSPPGISDLG